MRLRFCTYFGEIRQGHLRPDDGFGKDRETQYIRVGEYKWDVWVDGVFHFWSDWPWGLCVGNCQTLVA